ncbi:MAG: hypothetical protein ABI919_04790 [Ramlibacter sp.]
MTQWRDARLAQALAHAPDEDLRPAPAVRAAVLESAHRAAAGKAGAVTAPAPFWRRAWEAMGRSGQPWNAAFATVLLACLVTVLWWDKPVPDAVVDGPALRAPEVPAGRPAATVAAPAHAPAAMPADSAVAPARVQPPGVAGAGGSAGPAAAKRAPPALEKKSAAPVQAAPAPAPAAATAPPPPAAELAIAGRPAPITAAPAAPVAQTPAAMADARADAAAAGSVERSKAATPAAPSDAAPAPAPAMTPQAPAAAAPAQRREAAVAPFARDLGESSNRTGATGGLAAQSAAQAPGAPGRMPEPLSITLEGKSLAFTPAQAQQIEALAQALAAQADRGELLQSRTLAVIVMRRDRASAGVLQLAPPQVRWMPMRPGAQPLTGRPDAAQLQALLEVLQQLPER